MFGACGGLTHTTDQCRTLDESFQFLSTGWLAEHIGDKFILGPGPPSSQRGQQTGNAVVARISNDYRPQLPVVWKDIPEPALPYHVGTARLEETVNIRMRSVGFAVNRPYSDSEESDNDVLYAEEHDIALQRVSLHNEWLTQMTIDSCGERCA